MCTFTAVLNEKGIQENGHCTPQICAKLSNVLASSVCLPKPLRYTALGMGQTITAVPGPSDSYG